MTLGQRLTQLRNSKGLSQDALAEAIGVSRQSVSKWETDASIPDLEKLVKLSDFFAVSLDELVKGTPPASSAAPTGASWQHWLQRLISLYRKKAHLLGWLLAAWGTDGLLDSFQLIAHYYREMGVDTAFRAMKALAWLYVLHALKLLLGLFIVFWGRRFSGRFRWYHLGWIPVIVGAFTGPISTLLPGVLLYLPYYGIDRMMEHFALWTEDVGSLLCFLAGILVLIWGKRRQHS